MWTSTPTRPVHYAGEFFHVQDYARFMPAPYVQLPIYLAAVQSRMLQLAGSHADGWISGPLNTLKYLTEVAQPNVQKGMTAAGRTATGFERCVIKPCVIHQDATYARRAVGSTKTSDAFPTPGTDPSKFGFTVATAHAGVFIRTVGIVDAPPAFHAVTP